MCKTKLHAVSCILVVCLNPLTTGMSKIDHKFLSEFLPSRRALVLCHLSNV